MNDSFVFNCATSLCSSDHISGYVSANPVIDSREKITEQRLLFLYQLVARIKDHIVQQNANEDMQRVKYCFERAIQLTCSDISCGVIAVEPILYDRDQKISEVIELYFNMVNKALKDLSVLFVSSVMPSSATQQVADEKSNSVEYKTIVIPVYQKMKRSKIKKGKR